MLESFQLPRAISALTPVGSVIRWLAASSAENESSMNVHSQTHSPKIHSLSTVAPSANSGSDFRRSRL